jgi:hypothetical protein
MTLNVDYQVPIRWESATRYYVAVIDRDLFNELVVSRYWGGKWSRMGGALHEVISSMDDGVAKIQKYNKEREKRGYKVVASYHQ